MTMATDSTISGTVLSERVSRIIQNEQDAELYQAQADECKWAASEDIAAELADGKTQRQLGSEIGKSHKHVGYMATAWRKFGNLGSQRPAFNEAYHSPEVRGMPKPKDPEPLPRGGGDPRPDPPRRRDRTFDREPGRTGREVEPWDKDPEPDWGPDDLVSPTTSPEEAQSRVLAGLAKANAGMIEALAYRERLSSEMTVRVGVEEFFRYVEQMVHTYGGYLKNEA